MKTHLSTLDGIAHLQSANEKNNSEFLQYLDASHIEQLPEYVLRHPELLAHRQEVRKRQNEQFEVIVTEDGYFQCRHKVTGKSMQSYDVDHSFADKRV
jgi:hypothetical protein